MNKFSRICFLLMTMSLFAGHGMAADHGHDEEGHGHEAGGHAQHAGEHGNEGGIIELTPEQIRQAGLQTVTVQLAKEPETMSAPGVVRYNDYRTADVTSMLDAVVESRHVRLGDVVQQGKSLITLKSTVLAQAEGDWLRSQAEYRKNQQAYKRLKPLAADGIVSQARLQQSQSAYKTTRAQQLAARATLVSYGLSQKEIAGLEAGKGFGLVTLRAAIDGTVVADAVVLGQHIAAGSRLMRIIDEESVWVEVNLPPAQLQRIKPDAIASVAAKGDKRRMHAKVVGIHHELDAVTRTAVVRLEVDNSAHTLHAGMFVDAEISIGSGKQGLLLPETAIQRQGSELIVFVEEEPGRFERREVESEAVGMGQVAIHSGLREGERVVVQGVFALLSELLKSGFEAHNH